MITSNNELLGLCLNQLDEIDLAHDRAKQVASASLKAWRDVNNLTQWEVAQACGVSLAVLQSAELCCRNPKPVLMAVMRKYNI